MACNGLSITYICYIIIRDHNVSASSALEKLGPEEP